MSNNATATRTTLPVRHASPSPGFHPVNRVLIWAAVLGASVVAFAAVVALRAAGGFAGWGFLAVLGVAMLLIPTARNFSHRILLSVVGLAGIAPLMWWFHIDSPFLDRGTALLGLVAAILAGTLAYLAVQRFSFRRLIPEFRAVDALPLVAAAVSAWVVQQSFATRTFEDSLAVLTRSWDYAPHFNMFNMIRTYGSTIAVLPAAPDGSQWSAASYPQGYHSFLATLAEIVSGPGNGSIAHEAGLFLRLTGVVTVLGTLLVVSALTALPVFRRRLLLTLPFAALAATAWTVGPGAVPVFGAFPNYGFAVALCIAVVVLVQLRRQMHPAAASLALILALSGVAHGWILLLLICLPPVIVYAVYLLALGKRMPPASLAVQILIITAGLGGVLCAVWQLRKMSAGEVLTTDGGFGGVDAGLALLLIIGNALMLIAFLSRRGNGSLRADRNRRNSGLLLATPLYSAGFLVALAVFQLVSAGQLTYYFHKSLLAVALLAVFCTVIGAGELLIPRLSAFYGRNSATAALLVATLAATTMFGLPYTGLDKEGLKATAFGSESLMRQKEALKDPNKDLISKFTAMAALENPRPFIYVGFNDGFDPQLAAQWSLSLQGTWTEGVQPAIPLLKPLYKGPSRVPDAILPILRDMPDLDVMVDPVLVPELRAWQPEYAQRILSWE